MKLTSTYSRARRWSRFGLLASGLVAALAATQLVAIGPAAAQTAPQPTPVLATSPIDNSPNKARAAFCPRGTVVVGGGGGVFRTQDAAITAMYPIHTTFWSGFVVRANNPRTDHDWGLQARAVCAPRPAGYHIATNTVVHTHRHVDRQTTGTDQPFNTVAACPDGHSPRSRPISAGVNITGGSGAVEALGIHDHRSTISTVGPYPAPRTAATLTVRTYAICTTTAGVVSTRYIEVSPYNGDAHKNIHMHGDEVCTSGRHLYGTGVQVLRQNRTVGQSHEYPRLRLRSIVPHPAASPTAFTAVQNRYDPNETSQRWMLRLQTTCL
jgi:hypothetical protein